MRWHWFHDKGIQNKIKIIWKKGKDEDGPNYADYPTKHHATTHHCGIRSHYVRDQLCNIILNYNKCNISLARVCY